jgi:hypothetical protein
VARFARPSKLKYNLFLLYLIKTKASTMFTPIPNIEYLVLVDMGNKTNKFTIVFTEDNENYNEEICGFTAYECFNTHDNSRCIVYVKKYESDIKERIMFIKISSQITIPTTNTKHFIYPIKKIGKKI